MASINKLCKQLQHDVLGNSKYLVTCFIENSSLCYLFGLKFESFQEAASTKNKKVT